MQLSRFLLFPFLTAGTALIAAGPFQRLPDPDAAMRQHFGFACTAEDLPGADEVLLTAFAGPDNGLILADRGPFRRTHPDLLAPAHWSAPTGTRLVRTGAPDRVADTLLHARYTGSVRGRAVRMDLLIAHRQGLPVLRLRVVRPMAGSLPLHPLPPAEDLFQAVLQAWPPQDTAPCTAAEAVHSCTH